MTTQPGSVPREDEDLARRILAADRAAEEEFIVRYRPGLLAIASVRVGRDLAADLVQDVLTAGLLGLRRGSWKAEGPIGAYLATILRRGILRDRARRSQRTESSSEPQDLPSTAPDPQAIAESVERRDRIRAALAALPRRHAEVVQLHYFEGLSADAIGRQLEVPRGTVLSRLHHARKRLSRTLNRLGFGSHSSSGAEHE